MKSSKVLFVDIDDTMVYWSAPYLDWYLRTNFEQGKTVDTRDFKTAFSRDNYLPYNCSTEFLKRDTITPVFEFVKECFKANDITVVFTSACGVEAKDNQVQVITNLFDPETYTYGIHICNSSAEKVEMINKVLTSQRIVGMLLDDKRSTNSAVTCYATDSKDINHLRHMAHILWRVKADDKKTIKNRRN